ncbi:putative multidrug resistance protein [Polyplosphaeria fusca]|uniref:Multidrug resistance protein n=1 Tax=Polyplosphaeria fusca TaxID=682080 RepID=A0A9P4QW20_9PLEO|nr:putative multidrug resistance protein [Polyplosphaeria fusca]
MPSVLFLLLAPIRVNTLRKRRVRVAGNAFRALKLITIAAFAVLQFSTVILWATGGAYRIRTPATVASSLAFVASLAVFGLSYLEHSRSLRPSALLNLYLFFSVLFDAVVLRTLWIADLSTTMRDVFTASFALKGVIFFLEAKEKRRYLKTNQSCGPEETSGLYNQTFVWWLNKIIRSGYRHVLKPTDLYPVDESMKSEVLNAKFWTEWQKAAKTANPSLTRVVVRLLRWPLIIPFFPRLALLGFTFCQPLMIRRLLEFLQKRSESSNTGHGLIGAYAVVYFGMSVSNSLFLHRSYRFLTLLRGTLVAAIYTKTTELGITALNDSAAVTLMSTDVEKVVLGLRGLHDLWGNTTQLILATWLLGDRLGWACIAPIIVVLLSGSILFSFASLSNKFQLAWTEKVQKRVGATSNMLGHMKGIKMAGLTHRITGLIQSLRVDELKTAEKLWALQALTAGLGFSPLALSPVVTFAFYAIVAMKDNTTLDAPRMFTSLALLILLTQPLVVLFSDIIEFRSTFGSIKRIQTFLTADTRTNYRSQSLGRPSIEPSSASLSVARSEQSRTQLDDIELVPLRPTRSLNNRNLHPSDVVRISNASFGWTTATAPVLREINLSLPRSQLTLLIGPVASGKSTLLKGILGEVPVSTGSTYVSEQSISYCDQTPWLTNASVKHNIIGFSPFDQNHYNSVVYSCDLEQDIATFPKRHDTIVGSKGISLSTGQKQRIAVARAVYAKKDFVVFDDVFSGLDVNTQKNVFNRLLGPSGLLRKWESTVLVATHAVNLLAHSDHVIALSAEGTIAEQGTFAELNGKDGYVKRFCVEHANKSTPVDHDEKSAGPPRNPNISELQRDTTADDQLQDDNDKSRQLGDWAVYAYYFRTIGRNAGALFLTLSCLWAFFATFPVVWLKWYADANARAPNKYTGYYLGVYAALQLSYLGLLSILTLYSFKVMAKRAGLAMHEATLRTVMSAPMSLFSKIDIGSIITRFSQDLQLLDTQLCLSMVVVTGGFLSSIGQIGLIASAAYYISAGLPLLFLVYFLIQRYYLRTSRQMRFLDLEQKAPVYTQFIESLVGLATIRAFGWQAPLISRNHELVDRSQKPFYLMFMIQTWLTLVLDLITTVLAVVVVAVSVRTRETASVGFTGVSLTQIIGFTANFRGAILFWTQMETSIGAVARVKRFEEETEKEHGTRDYVEPPPQWPNRGNVAIDGLTVSYGPEGSRKALDNISLSVSPGQKLAIVGRTGSGKSTLILSFFRMVEISSGTITIDGIDITTIPHHHVRSRLNAVGEDAYFLDGSIRLNLDPYDNATDEQMETVLRNVKLWDTVQSKGGLDADFTEEMLSHGQKQVFCIARALLRPGNVVVMDEVTSAMDRETDALVQKLIRNEFREKTVITIAHRVDTVMDYDNVAVLAEGKVLEYGKPGELMEREGSVFADMVRRGT